MGFKMSLAFKKNSSKCRLQSLIQVINNKKLQQTTKYDYLPLLTFRIQVFVYNQFQKNGA